MTDARLIPYLCIKGSPITTLEPLDVTLCSTHVANLIEAVSGSARAMLWGGELDWAVRHNAYHDPLRADPKDGTKTGVKRLVQSAMRF